MAFQDPLPLWAILAWSQSSLYITDLLVVTVAGSCPGWLPQSGRRVVLFPASPLREGGGGGKPGGPKLAKQGPACKQVKGC